LNQNNGTIQLRFEGIDAMEKSAAEPFSPGSTEINLALLGVPGGASEAPGHILANQIGPNGRPIAFVYAGDAPETDGDDSVFLRADRMLDSVNAKLLASGVAYPLFYDTLYDDLRNELSQLTASARAGNLGLWPHDQTGDGVTWSGADSLEDLPPLFPKLWRRLQKYTQNDDFEDDSDTLDRFEEYLKDRSDRLAILSEAKFTGFDNIVSISGNSVSMTKSPEDLVFVS
jgi:hypothetical protein